MPEYDFDDTTVFVTGAAKGLGREHALQFARHGADVVALDLGTDVESVPYELGTQDLLQDLVDEIESTGSEALGVEGDVSEESEIEAAVARGVDEFGSIDVLVNNAGISTVARLTEMTEQTWDQMLDVNLKGHWLCAKHVGRHMIDGEGGGSIVNTSSVAGYRGTLGSGHYTAAKHGVLGLTKTLAVELAPHDVNVNAICPTVAATDLVAGMEDAYGEEFFEELGQLMGAMNLFTPEDPLVEPRDVSEAVLWLASDASRMVSGTAVPVDGGMLAK